MTSPTRTSARVTANPYAVGESLFAAIVMVTIGVLQFLQGLVALIDGRKFLVTTPNYVFELNATTWGWIHIVLGAVMAVAGFFIFTGNVLARGVGNRDRRRLRDPELPLAPVLPAVVAGDHRHRRRGDVGPDLRPDRPVRRLTPPGVGRFGRWTAQWSSVCRTLSTIRVPPLTSRVTAMAVSRMPASRPSRVCSFCEARRATWPEA